MPGGGIDEGESVEEAAVREAREETGIDVRVVRTLGMAEHPGLREPHHVHQSHFVQATPRERLPDEWEHHITGDGVEAGSVVRCYWLPVQADAEVWGYRGHFLGELVRKRVVGYVTRGRELLVFDHGRVRRSCPREGSTRTRPSRRRSPARSRRRRASPACDVVGELADADRVRQRSSVPERTRAHAFHAVTDADTPDAWDHHVTGTGMDAGIVYPCRWVSLDECPPLWGRADPLVETLRQSMTEE